jgi:hypothetical protein
MDDDLFNLLMARSDVAVNMNDIAGGGGVWSIGEDEGEDEVDGDGSRGSPVSDLSDEEPVKTYHTELHI